MLVIGDLQLRAGGSDPPRGPSAPTWMRIAVLVQGGGMLAFGVGLLLVPTAVGPAWPWTPTPSSARAIGAWLVGIGFAAFHANREYDFLRIRPLGGGYAVFAILQLAVIARCSGTINWNAPAAWLYLAFLLSILPVGLFGWFGRRSVDHRAEPTGPV